MRKTSRKGTKAGKRRTENPCLVDYGNAKDGTLIVIDDDQPSPKVRRDIWARGKLSSNILSYYCIYLNEQISKLPDEQVEWLFNVRSNWYIEYDWAYGLKATAYAELNTKGKPLMAIQFGMAPTDEEEQYKVIKDKKGYYRFIHFKGHGEDDHSPYIGMPCIDSGDCTIKLKDDDLARMLSYLPREIIEKAVMWLWECEWPQSDTEDDDNKTARKKHANRNKKKMKTA